MRRVRIAALMLLLVLPLGVTQAADGGYRVEQLAWLSGDWRIDQENQFIQEHWLEPVDGFISAVFRLFNGGRLIVHEYILVSQEGNDVILRFKHFNADYSTWEADEPLKFRLAELRDGYALFENVAQHQPEAPDLIAYERVDATLTATVSDRPGPEAGEPMVFRFQLH